MKDGIGVDFGTTHIEFCDSLLKSSTTYRMDPYIVEDLLYNDSRTKLQGICKTTIAQNIKRLIGKKFNDPNIQKYLPYLFFHVVEDSNGYCAIEGILNSKNQTVSPEFVASMVIKNRFYHYNKRQKKKDRSNKIVLTIPLAFKPDQKERLLFAAQQAGLEVITTIYEPIAAAIAHGIENPIDANTLIFDFGGGSLDVTVMHINTLAKKSSFKVLATTSDPDLGGENIDLILCDYFEYVMKEKGYDIRSDDQAKLYRNIQKLKLFSKDTKEILSDNYGAEFYFCEGDLTFRTYLRRGVFERLLEKKIISAIELLSA